MKEPKPTQSITQTPSSRQEVVLTSPQIPEDIESRLNDFVARTFLVWFKKKAKDAKISMQVILPSEMDYEKLRTPNLSLYGEYTINPETVAINHQEKEPRIRILDMKEFVGKPRSEVATNIVKTYGSQYNIPGIEYLEYLLENHEKVPRELTDGKFFYFFGSILRDQEGNSNFPCICSGIKLFCDAYLLNDEWREDDRVILLEK
jgi:hypothetical protein